ncbi:hypothetical protein J7643_03970 [bacterium]|nr:hypothetical protein [bacterium]
MCRSGWLVGLCAVGIACMTGCAGIPGTSSGDLSGAQSGFALTVPAPDGYQGTGDLSMRFTMPRGTDYELAALGSDIERIDVILTAQGAISLPPGIPLPFPASQPKGMPTHPSTEPVNAPPLPPKDLETFPNILTDPPPPGAPTTPYPVPAPPPRLEKPLYHPNVLAKASISRGELDKGQGDVVFNGLKAGVYGIELVAFGRDGQQIATSMQSATIRDGQTVSVNATFPLGGQGSGTNVTTSVTTGPGTLVSASAGGEVPPARP